MIHNVLNCFFQAQLKWKVTCYSLVWTKKERNLILSFKLHLFSLATECPVLLEFLFAFLMQYMIRNKGPVA